MSKVQEGSERGDWCLAVVVCSIREERSDSEERGSFWRVIGGTLSSLRFS